MLPQGRGESDVIMLKGVKRSDHAFIGCLHLGHDCTLPLQTRGGSRNLKRRIV